MLINDQVVFEVNDPDPIGGPEHTVVGLYGWDADTWWDNIRVYQLGVPLKADLLETAERHLAQGNETTARDLFREVVDSAVDVARMERARKGLVTAKFNLEWRPHLAVTEARLRRFWPKARLKIADGGLSLDLSDGGVSHLEPIRDIPLSKLNCSRNEISSLEPLRGMKLQNLDCSGNRIRSLAPLQGMPLEKLMCTENEIESLEPVRGSPLELLDCPENHIESLEPLRGSHLKKLQCQANRIRSLEFLRNLPLTVLSCDYNEIEDLAPLRGLSLTEFTCAHNRITNLEPVRHHPLDHLRCNSNLLTGLGSFVEKPPLLFYFENPTIPISELERARSFWAGHERTAALARKAEILIAARNPQSVPLKKWPAA